MSGEIYVLVEQLQGRLTESTFEALAAARPLAAALGVETVAVLSGAANAGLADELITCYSGSSRASAINNWEIYKRLFDGDQQVLAVFNEIGTAASRCAEAVRAGDLAGALAFSAAEWRLRTKLWPAVETAATKRLDEAARQAGARFARVCGAGGGGVMAVFAPPAKRPAVEKALAEAGGQVLPATIADAGLTVEIG